MSVINFLAQAPSFVLSTSPLPGESLSGLLARAAMRNVVYMSGDVLAPVKLASSRLGSVAMGHHLHRDRLAELLGIKSAEINQLFYRSDEDSYGRGKDIAFFGMRLPYLAREGDLRRVSFRSLRKSPHHRALWELRFLPWCSESMELLVSNCPSCEKELGWRKLRGVHVCEHCEADLRDFSGKSVPEVHRERARYFSQLFSCDTRQRDEARGQLHNELQNIPDRDLLYLIFRLGLNFRWGPYEANKLLCSLNMKDQNEKISALFLGVDRVLDWKRSMQSIIGEFRQAPRASNGYGILDELGFNAKYLNPKTDIIPTLLRTQIDEFYRQNEIISLRPFGGKGEYFRDGWMTANDMASAIGVDRRAVARLLLESNIKRISSSEGLRSPTLVKVDDVERLRKECADAISVPQAIKRVGLPEYAFQELIGSGYLSNSPSDVGLLLGMDSMISLSSVAQLEAGLSKRSQGENGASGDRISLAEAIKFGAGKQFLTPQLFGQLLLGNISSESRDVDNLSLASKFFVKISDLENLLQTEVDQNSLAGYFDKMPTYITYESAALFLGVVEKSMYRFVRKGSLPTKRVGRYEQILRAKLYEVSASGVLSE